MAVWQTLNMKQAAEFSKLEGVQVDRGVARTIVGPKVPFKAQGR